jgi:hypothetical protein
MIETMIEQQKAPSEDGEDFSENRQQKRTSLETGRFNLEKKSN